MDNIIPSTTEELVEKYFSSESEESKKSLKQIFDNFISDRKRELGIEEN